MKKKTSVAGLYLKALEKMNVNHVFGMTGGAVSFFLDEFNNNKKVKFIPVNHEQAAAMMAEAYARIRGFSSAIGTSGPGGTNLITGMIGSWMDSVPGLYITGQVSTFDKNIYGSRQRGFQEVPMVEYMKPHTKFSTYIDTTKDFGEILSKSIQISKSDRPGPVHLDIPINIQKENFNDQKLDLNTPKRLRKVNTQIVLNLLKNAKRPILIVGQGILHGGATKNLQELLNRLKIPVFLTWGYASFTHPNVSSTIGVYGNRGSNMCIQNSDLIIAIGTRLDTRVTGSNPKTFAPEATKVVVDIDKGELNKIKHDLTNKIICYHSDAKEFIDSLSNSLDNKVIYQHANWLSRVIKVTNRYPFEALEKHSDTKIKPYQLVTATSNQSGNDDIIVVDTGATLGWTMQVWKIKIGQKLFSSFGNSPMGYALPAAIGASFASNNDRVICMTGDGALLINIQELETLARYNLPVKIIVFNNQGFGLIRNFNNLYLGSRHLGSEYNQYNFKKIANAFNIPATTISHPKKLSESIKLALNTKGPYLLDVKLDPESIIEPRTIFGKTIGEQSPFLSPEEFAKTTKYIRG